MKVWTQTNPFCTIVRVDTLIPNFRAIYITTLFQEESRLNARLQQLTLHWQPREDEHFPYLRSYREEIKISWLLQGEREQGMGSSVGLDSFIADF